MAGENRPRSRNKNITGMGKRIYKRGAGLGAGPVGNDGGYAGRPSAGGTGGRGGFGGKRSGGNKGRGGLLAVILMLLLGGGGVSSLLGDGLPQQSSAYPDPTAYVQSSEQSSPGGMIPTVSSYSGGAVSSGWDYGANTGTLNTRVDKASRAKYTKLKGSGKDTVTLMIYMCGTDLESRSGMATADLQEMTKASIADNVNVIVYTGGCAKWANNIISSSVNQIYKVESGGLKRLNNNAGNASMTQPETLSAFIDYCTENYPADRNQLILWDHGGGSIKGFGYDQKFQSSGAMSLQGIDRALAAGGTKFDFIGFDACLMATAETALVLGDYADYLLASEETEPGTGWYYTNWLSALSENTSLSTPELGRLIIDDFVDMCARQSRGQQTTLSLIDLAELSSTLPDSLRSFARATSDAIESDGFRRISKARGSTKEFAASTQIDQVDLVHLAKRIGGEEANALADAILSAVKYNRTSANVSNAYGLSIYFPYRKAAAVEKAVVTYSEIGMEEEYGRCIRAFAGMSNGGQAASGYPSNPFQMLYDTQYGGASSGTASSGTYASYDQIYQIMDALLGGGAYSGNYGRVLGSTEAAEYLANNRFDASALRWQQGSDGQYSIRLPESQWELINQLELNVFFDDGQGFIDLGLDTVFDFTDDGALSGSYDGTWLAIDRQPVAYYHISTVDDGENYSITGRVPVLLNDVRADLILVFDNENPYGCIAGARYDYRNGETETVAKNLSRLQQGDRIDFLCDYYGYDGSYQDSYRLGDPYVVTGEPEIGNVYIDAAAALPCYRLIDIYHQEYWTPVLP